MYKTILLPLDGSDFAEHAIPMALAIARRSGSEIHVVSTVVPLSPVYVSAPGDGQIFDASAIEKEQREDLDDYLRDIAQRLRTVTDANISTDVLFGEAGDAIVEAAEQRAADLIVMATHGRSGISRSWLGSVAEAVLRGTALPVLLVRPQSDQKFSLDETIAVGTVVTPIHESPFSESILPHAARLADVFGAELRLLEVIVPLEVRSRVTAALVREVDARPQIKAATIRSQGYLSAIAAKLRKDATQVSTTVTTAPHAAGAILDLAHERTDSVIAMATHARGAVGRVLFGSVTDKVVRSSTAPVLVVRPSK